MSSFRVSLMWNLQKIEFKITCLHKHQQKLFDTLSLIMHVQEQNQSIVAASCGSL